MGSESLSLRDRELEQLLTSMANVATGKTRRSRLAVWLGSIGTFAVAGVAAGALTAGALATPSEANGTAIADTMQTFSLYRSNVTNVLGQPVFYSGSGTSTLTISHRPKSASFIAISIWCLGKGTITQTFAGKAIAGDGPCLGAEPQPRSYTWTPGPNSHNPLRTTGTGRFAVWAAWVPAPVYAKSSTSQVAAVADGVVTRDEYIAGFSRYQGCMAQAGYPVSTFHDYDIEFSYATVSGPQTDASDHTCYPREFQDIDILWQGQIGKTLPACLNNRGIAPGRYYDDWIRAMLANHLTPGDCALF